MLRLWNQLLSELREVQFALLSEEDPSEKRLLKQLEGFVIKDMESLAKHFETKSFGDIRFLLWKQIEELRERTAGICLDDYGAEEKDEGQA